MTLVKEGRAVSDVFVSYSRRDAEFVGRLVAALQGRGKEPWVDVEAIRDAEVFPAALAAAVEASDGFVFVISPGSVASPFCANEVNHALELNKRLVPIVVHRVPDADVPDGVRERNWIPFDDGGFDAGVDRLVRALDTDLEYAREHTRWLLKALEWEREGRDGSFLLRGAELAAAERWLASGAGKQPEPTAIHQEYVVRSRAAATRRLRALAGAMGLALAVAIALGVVALSQRNTARHATAAASSRELAALSTGQASADPELAILLGMRAVRTQATPQATFALRQALDASALRLTLLGHRGVVVSVDFSPDGRLIASSSTDDTVRIWNARTGALVRRFEPDQIPNAVHFTPDNASLLVAGDVGGTGIYDVATGHSRGAFQGADHLDSLAYDRSGRRLVTAGYQVVKLWDAHGPRLLRSFPIPVDEVAVRAAPSPDGRLVAASLQHGLRVWDARTGRLLVHVRGGRMSGLSFSPGGRELAFGGSDHQVRLMDPRSGRIVRTLATIPDANVNALAFSPGGGRLAAGSTDGLARVWDVRSGRLVQRLAGHRCCVADLAYSPDGSRLATGSKDRAIKVWSAHGDVLSAVRAEPGRIAALAFSADGRQIIAAGAGGAPVRWTVGSRARPVALPGRGGRAAAVSPDGSRLVAVSGGATPTARVIALRPARVERTLEWAAEPTSVAFAPDGRDVAIGSQNGATIFETATGRTLGRISYGETASAVAFAPHRDLLALGVVHTQETGQVEFASVPRGKDRGTLPEERDHIQFLAFTPDGSRLAYATRADPAVKLWNVATRRRTRELVGHADDVTAGTFSPDGRLLATTSLDRTTRVWDVRRGIELRAIHSARPLTAVAFSRDGGRLAIGDNRGTVSVLEACPGCLDPQALLALARRQATRQLTPVERETLLSITG